MQQVKKNAFPTSWASGIPGALMGAADIASLVHFPPSPCNQKGDNSGGKEFKSFVLQLLHMLWLFCIQTRRLT